METTQPGGRVDRALARRGLLILLAALAVGLAVSLISAGLVEWMIREIEAGESASGLSDLFQIIAPIWAAASTVAALAVAVGSALVGRASRTRAWSFVAIAAAIVGTGLSLIHLGLQQGDGATGPGALRMLTAITAVLSLVEWAAIGLAVREAVRAAGLSVSAGAAATWLAATGIDLVLGFARIGALSRVLGGDQSRLLVYGLSAAAVVARLILLAAARRALARGPDAAAASPGDGASAPLAADEPWRAGAADALGLYRAGLVTHVAIAGLGAIAAVVAGATRSSIGALLGILTVPELVAAALVVVGLFRLGALAPAAGIARLAGLCVLVAVAFQGYAASIAWRLTTYADRAASGSWEGVSLSDLVDLSRRLPALELGATVASLVGFLLVASALRATTRWLGHPALGARAVALSIGASFVALLAGCVRLYLAMARHPALGVAMPVAIAAMAIGLVLFVSYVGLLGQVIERLRGAGTALPAARIVNDERA
ncbi:MAG TPA: hypothetical protein VK698_20830 [Kofleriaceae bacterium]|nr:hypothetical protein [Kofleriaceae bacterium]